jgi:hypothetical protein
LIQLKSFIDKFPCSPAPERSNTKVSFPLTNASALPLSTSPSPFVIDAWRCLLSSYPGSLGLLLTTILAFGTLIGYEGPEVLILSENLESAQINVDIITDILENDLILHRVLLLNHPSKPFICSSLGLTPKPDGGWRRIHHLSHPPGRSVNDFIPESGELKYTTFQEILDMVIEQGRHCIIVKRDIRDAFRNVPVAVECQWLLGFGWKGKYYKERCLPFGLSSSPFLFNLFVEAIHWMIVSYLNWLNLRHYLDDFIGVFSSRNDFDPVTFDLLMSVLGVPIKSSKNLEGTIVPVFGIEVDINVFTARLPADKLARAIESTRLALLENSINLLEMQSLVGFLTFCSRAVRLGRVFMRRLWDFVAYGFPKASRTIKRRIPRWARDDLEWWNRLLSQYNGVLFFDETNRHIIRLYTDACLSGLGGFYVDGTSSIETSFIDSSNAFVSKIPSSTISINV